MIWTFDIILKPNIQSVLKRRFKLLSLCCGLCWSRCLPSLMQLSPQDPRLASDQCGIHLLAAAPRRPLYSGEITLTITIHWSRDTGGAPDKLRQTQSLDHHISISFGCDRSDNSINSTCSILDQYRWPDKRNIIGGEFPTRKLNI